MKSANECAPKSCQCGRRLSKPVYDWAETKPCKVLGKWYTQWSWANYREKVWKIDCKCGVIHVWSYHGQSNGCWKVRSPLPLMDSKQITVIA